MLVAHQEQVISRASANPESKWKKVTFCQRKPTLNEKAAQRVRFWAGCPADVHADIPADVRGQKLRSGPRNPEKKCGRP